MPVKTIPLLFIFLLNAGFLMLSADEKQPVGLADRENTQTASPRQETKSRYFQDSGSQVDSLVDRIRFKISYSWDKSAEYFRLACSSVTDNAVSKGRDIKAHADSKKDELLEKGRQTVRETTQQTMEDLSRKGEELKQDLNQMGREVKDEAAKEVREKTDKFFK
ncbi:MAG: hypothetical protein E7055_10425 [Lentisphaerae bacterium]|nr:hypothetical protein [Lentisphaerota bacterium]